MAALALQWSAGLNPVPHCWHLEASLSQTTQKHCMAGTDLANKAKTALADGKARERRPTGAVGPYLRTVGTVASARYREERVRCTNLSTMWQVSVGIGCVITDHGNVSIYDMWLGANSWLLAGASLPAVHQCDIITAAKCFLPLFWA